MGYDFRLYFFFSNDFHAFQCLKKYSIRDKCLSERGVRSSFFPLEPSNNVFAMLSDTLVDEIEASKNSTFWLFTTL